MVAPCKGAEVGVKLWLDDIRPAPDGWTWAHNAEEAVSFLARGVVEVASLDHDLGDAVAQTGYDVLVWVERAVAADAWYGPLPRFLVHSANPVGRDRMQAAIRGIQRQWVEFRKRMEAAA